MPRELALCPWGPTVFRQLKWLSRNKGLAKAHERPSIGLARRSENFSPQRSQRRKFVEFQWLFRFRLLCDLCASVVFLNRHRFEGRTVQYV